MMVYFMQDLCDQNYNPIRHQNLPFLSWQHTRLVTSAVCFDIISANMQLHHIVIISLSYHYHVPIISPCRYVPRTIKFGLVSVFCASSECGGRKKWKKIVKAHLGTFFALHFWTRGARSKHRFFIYLSSYF